MNPLRVVFNFIKSLFPRFNRKQRRRWFHLNKHTSRFQSLLARYHALWQKRPHGLGWWVRARRIRLAS